MSSQPDTHKRLHIVSHTHWDREWYLSHENFRLLLVDLVDHLIEIMETDSEFRYFQMDGQTIVLEDYLEIRPQMRPRLEKLIRDGRILIGPWYLQNDEYLTDGESTVRNLLIGTRICRNDYRVDPMMVGYVPDQFGNIGQLPQILNGFDIKTAVYGRGYFGPDKKAEFLWRSPDGSEVFSVFLMGWYNNAQRLPRDPEQAVKMLREIIEQQNGRAQSASRLLMNGVDHLEAQENLSAIIADVNNHKPGFELIHSTLPAYLDEVRKAIPELQSHTGELRDGDEGMVLTGTASSRVHLKQENFRLQQELRRWVEPFALLARLTGSSYGFEDPLAYAWKWLIQCHPHDSICGCSIDEVHFQMESRFSRVKDVLRDQLQRSLRYITASIDPKNRSHHSCVAVFNPHPFTINGVFETELDVLEKERLENLVLVDEESGEQVPFEILETRAVQIRVLNPKRLPKLLAVRRSRVLIDSRDLPGLGYKGYFLVSKTEKAVRVSAKKRKVVRLMGQQITTEGVELNNEHLTVKFNPNGTFDLTLKSTGRVYRGLHYFEDMGDIGNEYIFMRPKNDSERTTEYIDAELEILESSPLRQRVKATYKWKLPREVDDKSQSRRGRLADYPITSVFTLGKGDAFVSVETSVHNNVKDHRLRVMAPSWIQQTHAQADAPFEIVERPFELNQPDRNNQHPMESFFTVTDGTSGLAIFSAGQPEYEVLPKDSTLALTLLRCVDLLADFPAGNWKREQLLDDFVPGAQCLRPYTFRYAFYPYKGDVDCGQVKQQCDVYLHRPRLFQLPASSASWLGIRPGAPPFFDYFEDEHSLLPEPSSREVAAKSFFNIDNPSVSLVAVKLPEYPAPNQTTAILRLVNTTGVQQSCTLSSFYSIVNARLLKLNEQELETINASGNEVQFTAGPRKVLTLALTLEG